MKTFILASVSALALSTSAFAADPACNTGATSCSVSQQHMGDTAVDSAASNSPSFASQSGVSAATNNAGDVLGTVSQDAMTSSGAATTTTGAIRGGDASSVGNASNVDSDNRSTAYTGPIDASSGASTATLLGGNQSLQGGNQSLQGGNQAQTQSGTVQGYTGDVDSRNTVSNLTNTDVKGSTSENTVAGIQGQNTRVANGSESFSGGNTQSVATQTGEQKNANVAEGNKTVVSDNSSYRSKSIFIPSVVPGNQSSTIAAANIIKETTACGPLQSVVRTPITGTWNGLFRSVPVNQGFTYDLAPYTDVNGQTQAYIEEVGQDGVRRVFGHQAIIFSTVIGLASNRNVALGGGGSDGGWGQAGMGASSSNQQLVTNIQLKRCEMGAYKEVPVIVEVEPKSIRQ